MLRRSLARITVALAALVGGTLVSASPAQAAYDQCPAGSFCVWVDWDATGRFAYFNDGSSDLRNPIGGFVFDNRITTIWNRGDRQMCVWSGYDYSGDPGGFGIGGKGNLTATMNDTISSLRWC